MKWNKVTLVGTMRTVKMVRSKGYTQNKRVLADRKASADAMANSGRLIL